MSGKRFTSQRTEDYNFSDILDNGKWIGICHIDCENDFVNKFNELAEENEQLLKEMGDLGTVHAEELNKIEDDFDEEILKLEKENEQLKKDVEYWKQVASQYSNELNMWEHCKKYKTECKDIFHWNSD